ncbi:hypothetical protein IFR05_004376 [Cadophora sp. M221]|nr:hypothetical protein IFR05_004376 [Cadophora sp. M221]
MATPTSTSDFITPERTRSATLSPSPSITPSAFATSPPKCIHDIGEITAQLLSEDSVARTKCLAILFKGTKRCDRDFTEAPRRKYFADARKLLLGTSPISAEKVGKFVMRILFCTTHNGSEAYRNQLGCFYERHQYWNGDGLKIEQEFLRAVRQVFDISLVESLEEITTTPARLASDIPLRPALPTICDAACSTLDLDPSTPNEAKEGATCEPEVRSQSVMVDANEEAQEYHDAQESPSAKNATHSYDQRHLEESKVDSEITIDQADGNVTVATTYVSADIFSLSATGPKSEENGEQKEFAGWEDIPKISVCNKFIQNSNASRTTHNDALQSPSVSPQARSGETSVLTERFVGPDGDECDPGICRAEGTPKSGSKSGRKPRNGISHHKSVNANERIQEEIKKSVTNYGYIYILRAPKHFAKERPGEMPLLKIGKSIHPGDRIGEIRRECDIKDLERVVDIEDSSCRNYHKIEKLVHEELAGYAQVLLCTGKHKKKGGKTDHQEWFAVSETVALQTVQRWRRFIDQDPYDDCGILKDVWSNMINKKEFQREEDEDGDEHQKRHRYWTRWLDEGIRAAAEEAAIRKSGVKAAAEEAPIRKPGVKATEAPIVRLLKHLFARLLKTKLAHGFRLILGTISVGF